jgi:hypothetical protein
MWTIRRSDAEKLERRAQAGDTGKAYMMRPSSTARRRGIEPQYSSQQRN